MPDQRFKIENIAEGTLVEAINEALERAEDDVVQRPDSRGYRKVKIEIRLKPDDKSAQKIDVDATIKVSLAPDDVHTTSAFIDSNRLILRRGNPNGDDPNQTTIDDAIDKAESESEELVGAK